MNMTKKYAAMLGTSVLLSDHRLKQYIVTENGHRFTVTCLRFSVPHIGGPVHSAAAPVT